MTNQAQARLSLFLKEFKYTVVAHALSDQYISTSRYYFYLLELLCLSYKAFHLLN